MNESWTFFVVYVYSCLYEGTVIGILNDHLLLFIRKGARSDSEAIVCVWSSDDIMYVKYIK